MNLLQIPLLKEGDEHLHNHYHNYVLPIPLSEEQALKYMQLKSIKNI